MTMTVADAVAAFAPSGLPVLLTAYDGSSAGPSESDYTLHVASQEGLAYLVSAPGELGIARAYVTGGLVIEGVHPGDPHAALVHIQNGLRLVLPPPAKLPEILRSIGLARLRPPAPPPQERPPRWRRNLDGLTHSLRRDAGAIEHHYDVSNDFYRRVLGPSMTYTCAVFADESSTLEEAQAYKYDLVARKLGLRSGMRLLDVGCGWGGMVRHAAREYGVRVIGVTLSRQQATWAQEAIKDQRLDHLAEVRHLDYRHVAETDFDAVSSIGLTEHIGVKNYASYFTHLMTKVRPEGRLLNHCITRPHNRFEATGPFIDRYVFPDGELIGSGRIITEMQDVGWEVMHEENLRLHYARTLAGWNANLVEHWDDCVAEVGENTARVWGLYMAGSRLSFERNEIQLHQVLGVRTGPDGHDGFAWRPDWE